MYWKFIKHIKIKARLTTLPLNVLCFLWARNNWVTFREHIFIRRMRYEIWLTALCVCCREQCFLTTQQPKSISPVGHLKSKVHPGHLTEDKEVNGRFGYHSNWRPFLSWRWVVMGSLPGRWSWRGSGGSGQPEYNDLSKPFTLYLRLTALAFFLPRFIIEFNAVASLLFACHLATLFMQLSVFTENEWTIKCTINNSTSHI